MAGAAVVGAAIGYGADMLIRPTKQVINVTNPPPPTISYKPPLSASIQTRVDSIISQLSSRHTGETTSYYICNTYTRDGRDNDPKKVHLKNGVLTAMEPDDTINPNVAREDDTWDNILKGRFQNRSAQRFLAYRKMIYDPNRLLYPMKKVGARSDPNSAYVRITWDEALNAIAAGIKNAISKYGPYSLYDISQLFTLPSWLGAGVTGWSIFSFPGHTFERFAAFNNESYGSTSQLLDIFNSKLIVMWASTPSEGNTNDIKYIYHLAHEKGIPIISISPRYTEFDEIGADQWIPIRVGTDTAMQLAVANVLIKENLYNVDFVNKWVYGFDKWSAYVMGTSDKVEKTPEWAEPLTGVPATTIREFARYIAKMTPLCLHTGAGGARATLTENFAWGGIILNAMLGNMGKAGAYASCAGQPPAGWNTYGTPSVSGQYGRKAATFAVPSLVALMKMSEAVLSRPALDAGTMTKDQYNQLIGNAASNPVPNIKVWCPTHYSIPMQMDAAKQIRASKLMDLTFCIRNRMEETTSRVMDYVLPLAEELERDPNFQPMPNGFVYCQKLLQAPGEAKSEEWAWSHLAKLLGVLDSYFPILNQYTDDTWDKMWVDMCKAAYNAWAATDAAKPLNPPSWDDFVKNPVIRWDMTGTPTFAFKSEIVDAKGFTTTSSGKIQAYNDTLAKGTDYLKTTKYGGYIDPYPAYNYPLQFGGYHDANANDKPLVLMTTQPKYHTHSWMVNNPWLKGELWEHSVQLSVPDAKARGIVDGDLVSVIGDAGTAHMKATVTSRLTPGTCHIWKGTYFDPDPNTGLDREGCVNGIQGDRACAAKTYPNMSRVQVVKE